MARRMSTLESIDSLFDKDYRKVVFHSNISEDPAAEIVFKSDNTAKITLNSAAVHYEQLVDSLKESFSLKKRNSQLYVADFSDAREVMATVAAYCIRMSGVSLISEIPRAVFKTKPVILGFTNELKSRDPKIGRRAVRRMESSEDYLNYDEVTKNPRSRTAIHRYR